MAYKYTPPDAALPCRAEPDRFYPEDDNYKTQDVLEAIEACRSCWFMERCATLGKKERHGVWGGTTPTERRKR